MESANQGFPLGRILLPFPLGGDVGAPHMATLFLPGLAISLPVSLFSPSAVQNTVTHFRSFSDSLKEKDHLSTCHFRLIKNQRRLESSLAFFSTLKK